MKLAILVFGALLGHVYAVDQAVVVVVGEGVQGNVTFTANADGVLVEGSITGLTPGLHGFHIHEKGDLRGGCASAAGHFNPYNKTHGAPEDENRHVGDLGNIEADANGVATINIQDKLIALGGQNCILGRAVVVHADPDDLGKGGHSDSLTTGHAGARVGCGVIGIVSKTSGISQLIPPSIMVLVLSVYINMKAI